MLTARLLTVGEGCLGVCVSRGACPRGCAHPQTQRHIPKTQWNNPPPRDPEAYSQPGPRRKGRHPPPWTDRHLCQITGFGSKLMSWCRPLSLKWSTNGELCDWKAPEKILMVLKYDMDKIIGQRCRKTGSWGGSRIPRRRGRHPFRTGANIRFCQFFQNTCMKFRKISAIGAPLRSATDNIKKPILCFFQHLSKR